MRRALIFAHYDSHGIVDPHVMYALSCYRQYFEVIHFVSTADLDVEQTRKVATIVERVIVRDNIGYDFLSWRAGFEAIPRLKVFDEVVFANDSCYGPCSDMDTFWDRLAGLNVDLWGASINRQFRPHVQSFFMGFGRNLIRSGFMQHFWGSIQNITDKMQLILSYEVGLSSQVEEAGFRIGGLVDYPNSGEDSQDRVIADNLSTTDQDRSAQALIHIRSERFPNPVQLYCMESLRRGLPFLKVELLRDNLLNANLAEVHAILKAGNYYDISLITRHLGRFARCAPFPPAAEFTNAGLWGSAATNTNRFKS